MSRDLTLFQFDVDESTVRWALSSIPGVTPHPPDEPDEDAGREARDAGRESADGEPVERPGTETHLDETTATTDATAGPDAATGDGTAGGGPATPPRDPSVSTPWPGSPLDEPEEDGGLRSRLTSKKGLLAAGGALILTAAGVAAAWYLEKRSGDSKDDEGVGRRPGAGPTGAGRSAAESELEAGAADTTPESTGDGASDEASRNYPVDVAPVVGIGFLVVATAVLRRFYAPDRPDPAERS